MTVTAELADGRRLEFPDGTDPAVVQKTVKSLIGGNAPAASTADKVVGSFPARVAMGAASLPVALVQAGANIGQAIADKTGLTGKFGKTQFRPASELPPGTEYPPNGEMRGDLPGGIPDAIDINKAIQAVEESKKRGMAANGKSGFDWAGLLGQVGTGGVVTKGVGVAPTLAGKVAQGSGIGALFGFGTPVTNGGDNFGRDKAIQTGVGTATGGASPLVVAGAKAGGKAAYNLVEPYLPGGVERIVGRTANDIVGDRKQAVIDELLKNRQIVPGSAPTAGEAAAPAGSAEFSALQKIAAARKPSDYNAIAEEQQAARQAALDTVAGSKTALASAQGSRAAQAAKNYEAAFSQVVKADPELANLAKNPYFKDAMPDAMKLAEAKGITAKENLTEFLHLVKLSLDKTLGKTGDSALSNTERQTVEGVKNSLVDWIARKNPAYDTARQEFAEASKPINQMEVGQYLKNKLVSPLTDAERATSYAQAVRDAPGTLKRSTGFKRYDDLSQVLTPKQGETVAQVGEDLARKAQYEKLATQGMPATNEKLRTALSPAHVPNLLNRGMMVAHAILDRMQGKAGKTTLDELAMTMQSPQEMARVMANATPKERGALVDALMTLRNPTMNTAPIAATDTYGGR
jgi:hypothetical protein